MAAKFEITKRKSDQYIFSLLAPNGKILITSEVFATKADVVRRIESVKKYSARNANFQRMTSGDDASYFVIKDTNGDVIGKSKMYSSIVGMEKGMASVRANAPCAEVYDWVVENNRGGCRRPR